MHFTERLNKLIEDLGADTKTIAAFAGFDRSQLSRLRTGKLIPRPWSSTIEKLAAGLYLFSDNHNGQRRNSELAVCGNRGRAGPPGNRKKVCRTAEKEPGTNEVLCGTAGCGHGPG